MTHLQLMFFIIYMEESTCLKHLSHCGVIKSVPHPQKVLITLLAVVCIMPFRSKQLIGYLLRINVSFNCQTTEECTKK